MNSSNTQDLIEDGDLAARLLQHIGPFLEQEERTAVDALVKSFLINGWDPAVALGHVATLGALRRQRDGLTDRVAKGARARQRLYETAS